MCRRRGPDEQVGARVGELVHSGGPARPTRRRDSVQAAVVQYEPDAASELTIWVDLVGIGDVGDSPPYSLLGVVPLSSTDGLGG
jgi:hypothetical protein